MKKQRITDKYTFKQTSYDGKSIGLYIRVSSQEFQRNEQGEKERRASVEVQTQDALNKAKSKGWSYIIYDQDCNISGNEDAINRPAITAIIRDIKAGKLHTVYCRDSSRFVRNEQLWHTLVYDYFFKYGVDFLDGDGTDIKTNEGRMIAGIKAGQNQNFLTDTAKKSMRSKQRMLENGTLRHRAPFGYRVQEIDKVRSGVVKKEEAELVKQIFERFAKGEGSQKCLNWFQSVAKIPNIKSVYVSTIRDWVRNPTYKGKILYNGVEYNSPYPAIVSTELWGQANRAINSRVKAGVKRRYAANSHIVTGLVKCGYCFDLLQAGATSPHKIYENYILVTNISQHKINGENVRSSFYSYRCQTNIKSHKQSCPKSVSLKESMLVEFIKSLIGEIIAADIGDGIRDDNKLVEIQDSIKAKEQYIDELKKVVDNAFDMFSRAKISESRLLQIQGKNETEIEKNKVEISSLNEQLEGIDLRDIGNTLAEMSKWDNLTTEQLKLGVSKIIREILVYEDHVKVFLAKVPIMPFCFKLKYEYRKGKVIQQDEAYADLIIVGKGKARMIFTGSSEKSFAEYFKTMITGS